VKIVSKIKRVLRKIWWSIFSNRPYSKKSKKPRKRRGHPVPVNSINKTIINMVNYERKKRGLPLVIFDPSLEYHAISWSKRMAHERRLFHSGTILENCCMVPAIGSPNSIAKRAFYCWKGSGPHWTWMMHPKIERVAFGYWINGKFAYGAYAFNNP
jgi:uncharacterized protein YkwD